MHIVQGPAGIEHFVQLGMLRPLHINDRNPVFPRGNIRVRPCHVDVPRIRKRDRLSHSAQLIRMSQIKHLQSLRIDHKRVPELHRDTTPIMNLGDLLNDLRMKRIFKRDDKHPLICQDVGVRSRNHNSPRSIQLALRIERYCPLQEVVLRVAIEQRPDTRLRIPDHHKTLVLVRHIQERIHRMNPLLLVLFDLRPKRIESQRRGRSDRSRILCLHVKLLAKWRHRRGLHPLGIILDVYVCHIEHPEAAFAHGRIQILTTQLNVQHVLAFMLYRMLDQPPTIHKLLVVRWVRQLLEVASSNHGRLRARRYWHRLEPILPGPHIDVLAHEVQEVRSLHQQLRHPCVVVTVLRHVAIRAALGLLAPHRMRNIRTECLAAEPWSRNRLLRLVDPIPVRVLRTHHNRARRPYRGDLVPGRRPIDPKHVNIVAQHLEVVRRPVTRRLSLVM